jgi:hypothetical protein
MEMKYRLLTLSEGGIAMTIGTGYDVYQNYNYTTDYAARSANRASDKTGSATRTDPSNPDSEASRIPTDPDEEKKAGRRSSPQDCETCKKRKYQDGSDEGNVSFKTASHISPESAGSAVRAHENEHVNNAYNKAAEGNGEVLSATVSIHTSICPECGRSYISGGTTNTMIKYTNESNPYQQELKSADATLLRGANLDLSA